MSRYQQAPYSDDAPSGYGNGFAQSHANGNNAGAYGGYSDEPNAGYNHGGYGKAYGNGGAATTGDECELASVNSLRRIALMTRSFLLDFQPCSSSA